MKTFLLFVFSVLFAGCLWEPEKPYYDIDLGRSWGSSDSLISCGNPGPRTYIDFNDGKKFTLVTRFPSHVAVMEGQLLQKKSNIFIEWDTAGCWTKECHLSERLPEKCGRANDTATIERSGKIRFRDMLYTKWQ